MAGAGTRHRAPEPGGLRPVPAGTPGQAAGALAVGAGAPEQPGPGAPWRPRRCPPAALVGAKLEPPASLEGLRRPLVLGGVWRARRPQGARRRRARRWPGPPVLPTPVRPGSGPGAPSWPGPRADFPGPPIPAHRSRGPAPGQTRVQPSREKGRWWAAPRWSSVSSSTAVARTGSTTVTGSSSGSGSGSGSGSAASGSGSGGPREPAPVPRRPDRHRLGFDLELGLGLRLGGGLRLGDHQVGRQRDLRAPARLLELHGAAGVFALPGDRVLGIQPADGDLAELAQMLGERFHLAHLAPQLGRRLDEGSVHGEIGHRSPGSPDRGRLLPRETAWVRICAEPSPS